MDGKNRRFITLLVLLFFLTIFFDGCSSSYSVEISMGFPFAYLFFGNGFPGEQRFIWPALILNIVLFALAVRYRGSMLESKSAFIYTTVLIIFHMVIGILFLLTMTSPPIIRDPMDGIAGALSQIVFNLLFGYLLTLGLIGYILKENLFTTLPAGVLGALVLWLPALIILIVRHARTLRKQNRQESGTPPLPPTPPS